MIGISLALALSALAVDGDTIIRDREHIRIANIDAPETDQAKCDAERRLGLVAKRRLQGLLDNGIMEIEVGDPGSGRVTDRYGRTLALVTVDGRDVGEILIAEGLARRWNGKRRPWCD